MSYFVRRLRTEPVPTEDRYSMVGRIVHLLERGGSVAITAEGGAGKTTLLRQVLSPDFMKQYGVNPEQFLIAGVAGEDILGKNAASFWTDLILPDLVESAHFGNRPDLAEMIQRGSPTSGDAHSQVDAVFYEITSVKARPLLAWDDFDWVLENRELDENFFSFLRSLSVNYGVTYLIASERPLEALPIRSQNVSPFFNIFHFIYLDRTA